MSVIQGDQAPVAEEDEILTRYIPGVQIPSTTSVVEATAKADQTIKPGHFSQLIVDGSSLLSGPVRFGAAQNTDWFDVSPEDAELEVVLDLGNGCQQYLYLTRDTTVWLPTVEQREGMFSLMVEQDTTGGWKITWKINNADVDGSAVVYWPDGTEPVMSTDAGAVDMYSFSWCQNLNAGAGAYVGMATQNMKVPAAP